MRITDGMTNMLAKRDIERAQQDLFLRERRASSGLRVESASDDPVAAAQVTRVDALLDADYQYRENIERAVGQLEVSDTALNSSGEMIQRAFELAMMMSNDTIDAQSRQTASQEIDSIRDQLIALANSQHGDVYVFGGYETGANPFDTAGNYVGDTNQRQVLGDDGVALDIGINGEAVFANPAGQDIMADLAAFSTALQTNDLVGVRAAVGSMRLANDQIASERATIGGQWQRALSQLDALESRLLQTQSERPRLVEADAVEALSSLVTAQGALTRTLQVAGKVLSGLTLVDRL